MALDETIEVYVRNNIDGEGFAHGFIHLPCPQEQLDKFLQDKIHFGSYTQYGQRIDEYLIEVIKPAVLAEIGYEPSEYTCLSDLNVLAAILEGTDSIDLAKLHAVSQLGSLNWDEYANLALQADEIPFFFFDSFHNPGSSLYEKVAYTYMNTFGVSPETMDVAELENYFDYESFGRDRSFDSVDAGEFGFIFKDKEGRIDSYFSADFSEHEIELEFPGLLDKVDQLLTDSRGDNSRTEQIVKLCSGFFDFSDYDQDVFKLCVEDAGDPSAFEILNLAMHVDEIYYIPYNEYSCYMPPDKLLGCSFIDHFYGGLEGYLKQYPEEIDLYFDYEEYGTTVAINDGLYVTGDGFLCPAFSFPDALFYSHDELLDKASYIMDDPEYFVSSIEDRGVDKELLTYRKPRPASHPAPTVNATRGPVERDVSTQLTDAQRTAKEQTRSVSDPSRTQVR